MSEEAKPEQDQALLFDEAQFFAGAVDGSAKRYAEHTGMTTQRRDELVQTMLERIAAGASQREVARLFKVSRNTVAAIVAQAEAAGKLEPYKQRVSKKLGRAIESGVEQFVEALESGEISPGQLPVSIGILSDKKAQIDGEATVTVEHRKTGEREQIAQYIESLPSAAPESESAASGDESSGSGALPAGSSESDGEGTDQTSSGAPETRPLDSQSAGTDSESPGIGEAGA